MKYLVVLLFLTGCSVDEDCKNVTRSDLDYCNCYPTNCKPSTYKPKNN